MDTTNQIVNFRSNGEGKTFVCHPAHLTNYAIEDIIQNYPDIICAAQKPNSKDELIIFAKKDFSIKNLFGFHFDEKWILMPYAKVSIEEAELVIYKLVDWLLSYYESFKYVKDCNIITKKRGRP